MERREFFELAGLAGLGLRAPRLSSRAARARLPRPADDDALVNALAAVSQARHPGALTEADIQELKRQVAMIQQAATALRALPLGNGAAPGCVAGA